jgi:glycosyltransferase involved in cell wall biosynthesis
VPCVSVVIPLYQTEVYIGQALRSVPSQTFTDFEVLVIDDGSRDRGPETARSSDDLRVKFITQENRSFAGARNSGIRHGKSEYIALLDADDVWNRASSSCISNNPMAMQPSMSDLVRPD